MVYSDFYKLFYGFNRPFHEVKGYEARTEENGDTTLFINALGVSPEDIEVTVEKPVDNRQYLKVFGKTHSEILDDDFSINFSFIVGKPIKKITKYSQNGLLTLRVEYNKPIQPDVEIVNG